MSGLTLSLPDGSSQPALFDEPAWTVRWTVGQRVSSVNRTGVVVAIFDLPSGVDNRGLRVRFDDRFGTYECTFGFDHLLSDAAQSSDGPGACGPGPTSMAGPTGSGPAPDSAVAADVAAGAPAIDSPANKNSARPSCAATKPGA